MSNQALYFHSFFNDSIIFFGRETKIKILLKDIKDIKKQKNVKIFDNSISLKVDNETIFLTSFLSRDECYRLILEQMRKAKKAQFTESPSDNEETESEVDQETSYDNNSSSVRQDCRAQPFDARGGTSKSKKEGTSQLTPPSSHPSSNQQEGNPMKNNSDGTGQSHTSQPRILRRVSMRTTDPAVDKKSEGSAKIELVSAKSEGPKDVWQTWKDDIKWMQSNKAFEELEKQREQQVFDQVPRYHEDPFPLEMFDITLEVPFKFVISTYLYDYRHKFPNIDDGRPEALSVMAYFYTLLESVIIGFKDGPEPTPGQENSALKYIMDKDLSFKKGWDKEWPLQHQAYVINFKCVPSKPHVM